MLPEKINRFSCPKTPNLKHIKTCQLNCDLINILITPELHSANYHLKYCILLTDYCLKYVHDVLKIYGHFSLD